MALQVVWVPGSYELPVVASAMARSGKFDAVVCIGVVVGFLHLDDILCSANLTVMLQNAG